MPDQVVLIRAADWTGRSLSDLGEKQVSALALELHACGIAPAALIVLPDPRTIATAGLLTEIFADFAQFTSNVIKRPATYVADHYVRDQGPHAGMLSALARQAAQKGQGQIAVIGTHYDIHTLTRRAGHVVSLEPGHAVSVPLTQDRENLDVAELKRIQPVLIERHL